MSDVGVTPSAKRRRAGSQRARGQRVDRHAGRKHGRRGGSCPGPSGEGAVVRHHHSGRQGSGLDLTGGLWTVRGVQGEPGGHGGRGGCLLRRFGIGFGSRHHHGRSNALGSSRRGSRRNHQGGGPLAALPRKSHRASRALNLRRAGLRRVARCGPLHCASTATSDRGPATSHRAGLRQRA